jgi:hypothetical protein
LALIGLRLLRLFVALQLSFGSGASKGEQWSKFVIVRRFQRRNVRITGLACCPQSASTPREALLT